MEIYIVVCDNYVSQEAYPTFEKAVEFIESRNDRPIRDSRWIWKSPDHTYEIKVISINKEN